MKVTGKSMDGDGLHPSWARGPSGQKNLKAGESD